jgi:hypothetical protein
MIRSYRFSRTLDAHRHGRNSDLPRIDESDPDALEVPDVLCGKSRHARGGDTGDLPVTDLGRAALPALFRRLVSLEIACGSREPSAKLELNIDGEIRWSNAKNRPLRRPSPPDASLTGKIPAPGRDHHTFPGAKGRSPGHQARRLWST